MSLPFVFFQRFTFLNKLGTTDETLNSSLLTNQRIFII